jgi:dihydropteroate synthase-like protein
MKRRKILLVTGREAYPSVRRYAMLSDVPVEVHVCNVDIASLLSPKKILDEVSSLDLKDVSRIIVPGTLRGDVSVIREKLGIPCFKGPRNVSDLPSVLVSGDVNLSEKIPADEVLEKEIRENVGGELRKAHEATKNYRMMIGKKKPVFLGTGMMRILAEIPDAPSLADGEIRRISRYYVDSGADIIDLGMVSGEDNSNEIRRLVKAVRSITDVPVSIDSLNKGEILTAVDSGIDLILSLDMTNYTIAENIDIPAVIIPRDENSIPKGVQERMSLMEDLIHKLRNLNFDRFIVDLVLEPPNIGLVNSLQAFYEFRKKYPGTPMMLGLGNVTELMDSDSVGVNALLAAMASELDVDLLFTTEASRKTRGAVMELSRAVKMMYLSRKKERYPKDLGIDLLYLKDKKEIEVIRDPREKDLKEIEIGKQRTPALDGTEFRIYLSDKIDVIYYRKKEPELRFSGRTAKELYKGILHRGLVKNPEHAAYLGKELMKAEIALKLGKNYIQDRELF